MTTEIGVDVGGTFTDAILLDRSTNSIQVRKVPSTPGNQSVGFLDAIRSFEAPLEGVARIVHGTTVGTNAALERKGVVAGLVTTRGFRDIVEMGRRDRPRTYGMWGTFEPLISRDLRLEVGERMSSSGEVVEPLDEEALKEALERLLAGGAVSLLIGFINAHANPLHERRALEIARQVWPNPYITISSDILREYREFERLSASSLNAYLQPLIHRYVTRLEDTLAEEGASDVLTIMQANGGTMSVEQSWHRAINTVLSGPAAGVISAATISTKAGFGNVIACDMGGTSFDVGLVIDGRPTLTNARELAYNMPIGIPIIDIHTIGAGGGSIAHVNDGGLLEVGPESAGAVPGPIAFNRGGNRVTVTDANILLGRLPSKGLLGVEGAQALSAIGAAFEAQIGDRLGLSAAESAAAVLEVVNAKMANAIRLVTLGRGHDPRDFTVFAFGGAGPLHAGALARELGIRRVLVPYRPGISSALGCIAADMRRDLVQAVGKRVADLTPGEVRDIIDAQRNSGIDDLVAAGIEPSRLRTSHEADMQYEGQTFTIRVDLDGDRIDFEDLVRALRQTYVERFNIDLSGYVPRLVNVRTTCIGTVPEVDLGAVGHEPGRAESTEEAVVGRRDIWFGDGWRDTPVYRRAALPAGAVLHGPAIVEQMDSTTVIEPGARAEVDPLGNLIVTIGDEDE